MYLLDNRDSLILKGIAICAMLWHHLFSGVPRDISLTFSPLVVELALFGKVCVAIFLFVSGYGLTVRLQNDIAKGDMSIKTTLNMMIRRFVKLYANYWPVFILFVPVSYFVFHRSFAEAYGSDDIFYHFIMDLLGLGGSISYNPTWWFNKLMIYYYCSFPFLFLLLSYIPIALLLPAFYILAYNGIISYWMFAFLLGMVWAYYRQTINNFLIKMNPIYVVILGLFLLLILMMARIKNIFPIITNFTRLDGFIALVMALLVPFVRDNLVGRVLAVWGKHSMNVYMIHTFIYFYWFSRYVYFAKYSILIFLVLLVWCLILSALIEYIKQRSLYNKIVESVLYKIRVV